jgi:hypothetical protein
MNSTPSIKQPELWLTLLIPTGAAATIMGAVAFSKHVRDWLDFYVCLNVMFVVAYLLFVFVIPTKNKFNRFFGGLLYAVAVCFLWIVGLIVVGVQMARH